MSLEASARALNPKWPNVPAIFIPYYTAAGEEIVSANDSDAVYFRVRLLGELPKGFTSKKATRYRQEPHSGVRAYFARVAGLSWPDILSNPQEPLLLTEGEFKSLVGCLNGFNVVGLGGVWNFTENGALLPELLAIAWKGRVVYIVFDSDVATNP